MALWERDKEEPVYVKSRTILIDLFLGYDD